MVKKLIIGAAIVVAATAAHAGSCSEYFKVKSATIGRDGKTTYSVVLTKEARENLTDTTAASIGSCFVKMLKRSPNASVIKLKGENIDLQKALEMRDF